MLHIILKMECIEPILFSLSLSFFLFSSLVFFVLLTEGVER